MKKILSLIAITAIFSGSLMAQENPFKNSTWKITKSGEKTILTKTAKINPVTALPKFHYIDFSTPGKMSTGTVCYRLAGFYEIYDGIIAFSEGMTDMADDCEEPENLIGNYSFVVKANTIVLLHVDSVPEEAYEGEEAQGAQAAVGAEVSDEAMEATEAVVEAASAAVDAASGRNENRGKKPIKKGVKK